MSPYRLLLLAAALLIVQLGGLLHGLSHLTDHHGGEHGDEPQTACEWCLAYAGLDQGLAGPPPIPPGRVAPPAPGHTTPRPGPVPGKLPYRSRAPPVRLA